MAETLKATQQSYNQLKLKVSRLFLLLIYHNMFHYFFFYCSCNSCMIGTKQWNQWLRVKCWNPFVQKEGSPPEDREWASQVIGWQKECFQCQWTLDGIKVEIDGLQGNNMCPSCTTWEWEDCCKQKCSQESRYSTSKGGESRFAIPIVQEWRGY